MLGERWWRVNRLLGVMALCLALILGASSATPVAAQPRTGLPDQAAFALSAPGGLRGKASAGGADTIVVSWRGAGLGGHYQLRLVNGRTGAPILRRASVPSATIGGLWPNTSYFLRIRTTSADGTPSSSWSKWIRVRTKTPADTGAKRLRVATYNIRNGVKSGPGASWSNRRRAVADMILSEKLDVVGLQEAEHNRVASGVAQYRDLLNLLGPNWRITSTANTAGTRIIYNAKSVSLGSVGARKLTGDNKPKRFVAWGVFTQKSNGRRFLFADTHLVRGPEGVVKSSGSCSAKATKYYKMRKKQAGQVVASIRSHAGRLPVVLVGDMNSHKFHCPNNGPYRVYRSAGLVDPIGNPDRSKSPVGATTEVRIHTEYDSSNHFKAAPKRHGWINGTNVDYIWVSRSIHTLAYETVVNLNQATGAFQGVVPSDHNMIRATVLIPKS